MRYTKIALLTFGAGLVLGLVVVVIELDWLDRVASSLMALGLMAIPLGMIVDWRLAMKPPRRPAKSRGTNRPPRPAGQPSRTPRPRKAAPPKRSPKR
ncbi:MAG: hypothetical protein WB710_02925 [Stellaceae bacterium]